MGGFVTINAAGIPVGSAPLGGPATLLTGVGEASGAGGVTVRAGGGTGIKLLGLTQAEIVALGALIGTAGSVFTGQPPTAGAAEGVAAGEAVYQVGTAIRDLSGSAYVKSAVSSILPTPTPTLIESAPSGGAIPLNTALSRIATTSTAPISAPADPPVAMGTQYGIVLPVNPGKRNCACESTINDFNFVEEGEL